MQCCQLERCRLESCQLESCQLARHTHQLFIPIPVSHKKLCRCCVDLLRSTTGWWSRVAMSIPLHQRHFVL
ncbi:hypothetical protein BD777DRAFT_126302 [Yarrowia lipolytica]|nr:hypothetical protein BD777DRAFT_126302 [Yarrowia lipolytica]